MTAVSDLRASAPSTDDLIDAPSGKTAEIDFANEALRLYSQAFLSACGDHDVELTHENASTGQLLAAAQVEATLAQAAATARLADATERIARATRIAP